MFIVTFMSAFIIKDFHIHPDYQVETLSSDAGNQAVVHGTCYICDFTFQKVEGVKIIHFVPAVTVKYIERHVFSAQTVCRDVESVNAHSPPFMV